MRLAPEKLQYSLETAFKLVAKIGVKFDLSCMHDHDTVPCGIQILR